MPNINVILNKRPFHKYVKYNESRIVSAFFLLQFHTQIYHFFNFVTIVVKLSMFSEVTICQNVKIE